MQTRTLWLAAAMLTAAPAVATLAQAPAAPAQTYTLRYKFTPGQTLAYKLTMDTAGTVNGGPQGQAFPIQTHLTLAFHQTVSDVRATDGAATVVTKFDAVDGTMNGQPLPNVSAQTGPFKDGFTTVLTPSGKTLSVKSNATGADAATGGMDFSKMGSFQGAAQLPDAPVKLGDTWNGSVDLNNALGSQMAGVQASLNSTLSGVLSLAGKNIVSVAQVTKATFDGTNQPATPMNTAGTVDGTGTLKFDVDAGQVVSQVGVSNLNMTLTPKTNGGAAPAGVSGPLHLTFKINTDLERVDAPAAAPAPAAAATP